MLLPSAPASLRTRPLRTRLWGRPHVTIRVCRRASRGVAVPRSPSRRAVQQGRPGAGRTIDLKPREYQLLEYLARRRGQVVTRQEIEAHIYDEKAEPMSNVVESAICALRRKIDRSSSKPLIHTRRGMGYLLGES